MGKFSESQRRLAALAEIAAGDSVTQRSLASRLEVSLGLANTLLRELERDGLVRVTASAAPRAARYAVTRSGRSAMLKMARAFAAEAEELLRRSLGGKAPAARLLSARTALEAKRGR